MSNHTFQLDYDLLQSVAQKFKEEGEDMAKLYSSTRQRLQSLRKEWIGEAAEKFFEEMETELLPALQRLSQALFQSRDVSGEIMRLIQDADTETAGYFKSQLSGDDFGADMFGQALEGLPGGSTGNDAFETGNSEESSKDTTSLSEGPGSDTTQENKQAPESQEKRPDRQEQESGGGKEESKQQEENEPTPAGGGGGGSSSPSQGLQGDLKNMGVGLSGQAAQWATTGSGADVESMPDHIYERGGSPAAPVAPESGTNDRPEGGEQDSSGNVGSIAAGAAGIAGAAAAGKMIKDIKAQEEEDK